jgi:purine-binding chemotaxis protein CheW
MTTKTETIEGTVAEYVTAVIGGQLFGLPISRVQDVFMPERLTRVPLSSAEIAGVLNLRGRIVTVVDMRARLGLPRNDDGKPPMAVGVDLRGESYGLLIDQIGEVLRLADDGREENPVNLDPRMAKLAGGVHRLDGQLMVVLDVDRVLEIVPKTNLAAQPGWHAPLVKLGGRKNENLFLLSMIPVSCGRSHAASWKRWISRSPKPRTARGR